MKKAWITVLALVCILCLCACGQGKTLIVREYTFPEGTSLFGVDVTELNKEDAWAKLEAAAAGYELALTVDGVTVPIRAQDIDLTCSRDAFELGVSSMEQGVAADFSDVIRFNEGKLRALMHQHFNKDVTEAAIVFDETASQYVLVPHADGQKSNPNALVAAVKGAVCTLSPTHTLTGVSEILHPVRSADAPQVQEALALANKMIGVKLAYTFDGSEAQEIPAETIRSFVMLGEDGFTPVINQDALDAYVTQLSETYSIEGTSGSFQTTGGDTINLTVDYNGLYVDNAALAQDIVACMQEGISETRTAPYLDSGNRDMAYGGTYIEVNLSSQHLWFYKNGERLVSTSLVSGKVAENMCTPTGIYSIYAKSADTYLTGANYRTFVNYWMPFHYGYGLHDATWRGSFGGDIYLYSGSHGCVNLPLSAAATIYNNAPVGTKVILYGGKRSVPPLDQKLTGTTSYDVADDAGSFTLNIKPKFSDPKLTYSSDNSKVAAVDAEGKVTIKGVGSATITVTAPEHSYYTDAKIDVTVNVHSACEEGRHVMGEPTTVKAPTCQSGLQKTSCTKCSHYTEKELPPASDHSYDKWVVTKEPACSEEGVKERTCTVCGEKQTAAVPATGQHTEGEWKTTRKPTCVSEGTKETKCTVCGTVMRSEQIPATGEHIPGEWKAIQKATCSEEGTKAKYCTVCEKELETGIIKAGHRPGDWQVVKEATCTEDGRKAKLCTRCGEEMETAVIKAAHVPGDWTTVEKATCSKEGKQVKKCTVCDAELETKAIARKDHPFDGGASCPNCGAENPDYVPPTSSAQSGEEG